ncbi:MAG: hypothetical protein M1812_007228 [Candelaria pacifica]|nr:MAG: hypothetical protein M1812_007228 [Candelaria pacifica]
MEASHELTEAELVAEAEAYASTAEILGRRFYELAAEVSDSEDSNGTIDEDATEPDSHVSDSEDDDGYDDVLEITGETSAIKETREAKEIDYSDNHTDLTEEVLVQDEPNDGSEEDHEDDEDEPTKAAGRRPLQREPVYSDEFQGLSTDRGTLEQIMKVNEAAIAAVAPPPSPKTFVPAPSIIEKRERTFTIAFQLPLEDEPTKIGLPFSTSFNTLLTKLQAMSIPVAREINGASSIGFTLEDGPWFYSVVMGYGRTQRKVEEVRCLNSNLQYLAMVSEMSRARANFALFWHAKINGTDASGKSRRRNEVSRPSRSDDITGSPA